MLSTDIMNKIETHQCILPILTCLKAGITVLTIICYISAFVIIII
jgi:hypothetical protein